MYIIIDHGGSEEQVKYTKRIKEFLEEEYNATVESTVGRQDNKVALYDEELQPIATLTPSTDIEVLNYYLNHE